jgi:hypothetical protein
MDEREDQPEAPETPQSPPDADAEPEEAPAAPAAGGEPGEVAAPPAEDKAERRRARQYAARRREWIGTHGRDDRFLIFVGVATVLLLGALVAFWVLKDLAGREDYPPVPLAKLFHAPAEEIAPGVVRVEYDFAFDDRHSFIRDACPQLGDWHLRGRMDSHGIMVGGAGTYRPFFEPGGMSVECDVALVTGSQVTIFLKSIYDHSEGNYFRFDLTASRDKHWPSTAQISRYEGGARREASRLAQIPALRARRDPPLWYRVKLELSDGKLVGYYSPKDAKYEKTKKLPKVCELLIDDDLGAGKVVLTGDLSRTAYDNVVVTGRPHAEFRSKRTQLYYLFDQHKTPPAGVAASDSPTRGAQPSSAPPKTPEK